MSEKNRQADQTFFRAFVMGVALVVATWAGFRYTTIPKMAVQYVIGWYEGRTHTETAEQGVSGSELSQTPTSGPIPVKANAAAQTNPPGGSPPLAAASRLPVSTNQSDVRPAGYEAPIVSSGRFVDGAAANRRSAIEAKLADLGVVYCLLESYGRKDRRYRFHCDVGLAGAPDVTHSFEAVGSDPVAVMEKVLADVEKWRGPIGPHGW